MSYRVEKDWTTKAGFRAVVTMSDMGHHCGYVGLPKGHPLYGVEYNDPSPVLTMPPDDEPVGKRSAITLLCAIPERMTSPEVVFDVHGSLTFSGGGQYPVLSDLWWFGYDCGHAGDLPSPEYLQELRERYPGSPVKREGTGEFRSLEYCIDECESLARQIKEKVQS